MNVMINDVCVMRCVTTLCFLLSVVSISPHTNEQNRKFVFPNRLANGRKPKAEVLGIRFPQIDQSNHYHKAYDRKSDDDDLRIETTRQRVTNAIINRSCCQ